jgi:hypothetical protein
VRERTAVSSDPMHSPTTRLMMLTETLLAVEPSRVNGRIMAPTVASPTIQEKKDRGLGVVTDRRWARPVAATAARKAVTA